MVDSKKNFQGNHMIIVTPSFSKSSVFHVFFCAHENEKSAFSNSSGVRFKERFRKASFPWQIRAWMEGLTGEIKLCYVFEFLRDGTLEQNYSGSFAPILLSGITPVFREADKSPGLVFCRFPHPRF